MFLSRGDRDLGVAFQTHPGRQAFISSGSTQGVMETALHPKTPTTSLPLEQEASCGLGLMGSKGPGGPQDESQPHPNPREPLLLSEPAAQLLISCRTP